MITGEDIDRCIVERYAQDFDKMTLQEAKEALRFAEQDLGEVESWVEALQAFIRMNSPAIS